MVLILSKFGSLQEAKP